MDKGWLLKREALQVAKRCIQMIESELGVRLKLADPEFLQILGEYVGLLEQEDFQAQVACLYEHAGLQSPFQNQAQAVISTDVIQFAGKSFPKFKDNKEFKHLYRGQPVYA